MKTIFKDYDFSVLLCSFLWCLLIPGGCATQILCSEWTWNFEEMDNDILEADM